MQSRDYFLVMQTFQRVILQRVNQGTVFKSIKEEVKKNQDFNLQILFQKNYAESDQY